jgi:hypothetical protein
MRENVVIQKVADAESAFNALIEDYNKLLDEYKAQTSFAAKIKQAVLVKKVDVAIYNVLNTTTALIKYAVLKNILDTDLAKHYTQLFKQKFNIYKTARESVFNPRQSKILAKRKERQRAKGQNKEASLQSVPVPSASAAATSPEAVL